LTLEKIAPPHHFVQNEKTYIEQINKEILKTTELAKQYIAEQKTETNQKLNKNRVKTEFSVGDYVFVKDMQQVPGNPGP
jgi:hypothetical protein